MLLDNLNIRPQFLLSRIVLTQIKLALGISWVQCTLICTGIVK